MLIFTNVVIFIIALEHFGFLILEMFLWDKPLGRKIFSLSKLKAEETKSLAANQGLYNGFLAAGLLFGLFYTNAQCSVDIISFFLICIIIAGIYGAYSVKKSIFLIQALPAIVGLSLLLI